MAKSSAIKKVDPAALAVPDFLKEEEIQGLDDLKQFVRPPTLKIVQKSSDSSLLDKFDRGDCIILPSQLLLTAHNSGEPDSFLFVPLFFYAEWCTWTPFTQRGNMPAVIERSLDCNGALAAKAKNPKTRNESSNYEGTPVEVRHVEHLNFVITLYDHQFAGEPMVMSFSKGEWGTGSTFSSLIKMRKASLFSCVFQASVCADPRKNSKGEWFGYNISNPDPSRGSPWVSAEENETFKTLFAEISEHHKAGILRTDYEDDGTDTDDAETAPSTEF